MITGIDNFGAARQAHGVLAVSVALFLKRMGVSETAVTHPTTTLEDLFIRVVRENTPNQ